jgi:hypothetical protein
MDNSGSISIGLATPKDIQGILAVQEENQPEHGGQLSVRSQGMSQSGGPHPWSCMRRKESPQPGPGEGFVSRTVQTSGGPRGPYFYPGGQRSIATRARQYGNAEIVEFDHDKVRYIALKFKD